MRAVTREEWRVGVIESSFLSPALRHQTPIRALHGPAEAGGVAWLEHIPGGLCSGQTPSQFPGAQHLLLSLSRSLSETRLRLLDSFVDEPSLVDSPTVPGGTVWRAEGPSFRLERMPCRGHPLRKMRRR